jgi:hypothetical protein
MCDFQYYFVVPSSSDEDNAVNESDSEPMKKIK